MIGIDQTRLVLQGEYSIVKSEDPTIKAIRTSTPTICTVFTLFSSKDKISILAHIDYTTCYYHTFVSIIEHLKNFKISLTNKNFTATIDGGAQDSLSQDIQNYVKNILKLFNIEPVIDKKNENYEARQQILMNTREGKVIRVDKNMPSLEFLQERENGCLGKVAPTGITVWDKIREATRNEDEIKFMESEQDEERNQRENSTLPLKTNVEKLSTEERNILALKVWIYAVVFEKDLENTLKLIKDKDFNLLFRKLAADPKYLGLLKILLKNKNLHHIDIKSEGKISGTALDIAKKYKNSGAIELLEKAYEDLS